MEESHRVGGAWGLHSVSAVSSRGRGLSPEQAALLLCTSWGSSPLRGSELLSLSSLQITWLQPGILPGRGLPSLLSVPSDHKTFGQC